MSKDILSEARKKFKKEAIKKIIISRKTKAVVGLSLFLIVSLIIGGFFAGFSVNVSNAFAAPAIIVAFDANGLAGDEVIFNATTNNTNLNTSTLSRGAGVNPQPLANGFSATAFVVSGTKTLAISNAEYFQIAISAKTNYKVSLSSLDVNLRKSSTGPNVYQWQYSLDGFATSGIDVGTQGSVGTADSGAAMPQINLSGIANLQNVVAGTTITFRLYAWGASGAAGTFAVGRLTGNDLTFMGEVIDNAPPTFTINDGTAAGPVKTDTINVTASDLNLNTGSLEYGFSADNVCNVSDTYGNLFTNTTNFGISGNHTDYLCVKAADAAGNIGYLLVGKLNTDNTAPTLSLPSNITIEATSFMGATTTYIATATDINPASPVVICLPASGSIFLLGQTTVSCSATDTAGNIATGSFKIIVQDTTSPIITLNGSASINLHIGDAYAEQSATATDAVDGSDTVIISGDTVSALAPAVFHINYNTTDAAGNHAIQVVRTVNVSDISAPVINAINNVTVEATGPSGAVATYGVVTATDDVDGIISATCLPASGSIFLLGQTTISCSATDTSGNIGNGTGLTVNVTDNTPPTVIVLPATQTVEAINALGATATFTATATDIVDGDISASVVCDAASGGTFIIGNTTVTCSATDSHGNKKTETIVISVKDTTAPIINGTPANTAVEATSNLGAVVSYIAPTATDLVDATDAVTCSPASGSTFAIGTATITCNSADSAGNIATPTSFKITVQDTTAPVITVPADIAIDTANSSGKTVAYTEPTALDLIDGSVATLCNKNSGNNFSVAETTVSCLATDAAGNTATKTFKVTVSLVQPPAPPPPAGGAGGGGGAIAMYLPEPALAISEQSIKAPEIAPNSLTIVWTTNFKSSSYVVYSTDKEIHSLDMSDNAGNPPKYGYAFATAESDTSEKVTSHSVTITGLDPNKTYYFRTVSRGSLAISGEYKATTPTVESAETVKQTNIPEQIIKTVAKNVSQEKKIAETKITNPPASPPTNATKPTNTNITNIEKNKPSVNTNSFLASLGAVWNKIFSFSSLNLFFVIAIIIAVAILLFFPPKHWFKKK